MTREQILEQRNKDADQLRMALGLAEVPCDYWTALLIKKIEERIKAEGEKFSVKSAVAVRGEVDILRNDEEAKFNELEREAERAAMSGAIERGKKIKDEYEKIAKEPDKK